MSRKLPQEILDIICEYADVKCRNGVYICQISKNDQRYDILRKIPSKKFHLNNKDKSFRSEYVRTSKMGINYFSTEYEKKSAEFKLDVSLHKPLTEYDGYYRYFFYTREFTPMEWIKYTAYDVYLSGKCIQTN